jgi:hypothetical protein
METDVTKLKIGQIWSYLYLAISEDTINIDMVLIHYLDDKRAVGAVIGEIIHVDKSWLSESKVRGVIWRKWK